MSLGQVQLTFWTQVKMRVNPLGVDEPMRSYPDVLSLLGQRGGGCEAPASARKQYFAERSAASY